MDAIQFKRISRILVDRRISRRALTREGAGLIAGVAVAEGLAPASTAAQDATPVAGDDVELLFVQSFGGGTITPGEDGAYKLTLEGGLGETIYFSDRPNRIVGTVPTIEFLTVFDEMMDDPPNAALVANGAERGIVLVVELTGASLDETTGALTYEVELLGQEDIDMRFELAVMTAQVEEITLETCHLFIDNLLDSNSQSIDFLPPESLTAPLSD